MAVWSWAANNDPLGWALLGVSWLLAAALAARGAWAGSGALAVWGVLGYAGIGVLAGRSRPPQARSHASEHLLQPEPTRPVDSVVLDVPVGSSDLEAATPTDQDFLRGVEESLRNLNKPSALARSPLMDCLPRTLAAARGRPRPGAEEPTPLERAQALRETLVAGIERLKPDGEGTAQALQYHILHDEYVVHMPTKHIMVKHSISESTFHRYRHAALTILAEELQRQEAGRAGRARVANPVALDYLG